MERRQPIRVLFVCLGNICRSPLGEGIFKELVRQWGLSDQFEVDSAGTAGYHIGEAPHPGSRKVAKRRGLSIDDQRARQFARRDLDDFDYIIAMDASNRRDIEKMGSGKAQVFLMRDFDPEREAGAAADVPDPWGMGDAAYEETYAIIERSCRELLQHLIEKHQLRSR
ncbi:low molecular weight protein-tyrosine-phosphatase [Effusibacillus pohliae]|uniref:low molecular weight protein-tyrosine-phosphatase n=1 Tax=Effusibacillus pohliae TaxID=232270 RepID=UPI0003828741|nr:low molecular weight protein-tyrosine-phosphatase [Effusibacillus pohliae]